MRRTVTILGLVLAGLLVLFWATGGFPMVERWAANSQREVQNALAGALRQLRAGSPGAVSGFLLLCFSYGFFHAVGPGHGKMLIGSYGLGSRVRLFPLAGIAVLSSLAQAAVAVVLVYAGIALLGWTRERVLGLTEEVMAPISYAAFAGIGLWLVLRGWRGLRHFQADAAQSHDAHHHHHHDDPHHVHDETCGHRHGPTLEEVAAVTGWRDVLALTAGVAIRPCSGTLFVLVLTWQMGIAVMGVWGAAAIGLGTALVTVVVAVVAVWAREGAVASLPGAQVARFLPVVQLLVGAGLALVSLQLLIGSI